MTLAFSMLQATAIAPLIALPSGYQRCLPGFFGTVPATIDIASVTVAADDDLAVTTGTVVKTGSVLHRQLWPVRTGLMGESDKYLSGSCYARPWGAVSGDCRGQYTRYRTFSTARSIFPVSFLLSPSLADYFFWPATNNNFVRLPLFAN